MWQSVLVATLVTGSVVYAMWSLMPQALRRRLAVALSAWPLPAPLRKSVERAARAASGCGCDGCDAQSTAPRTPPDVQPLVFHPRRRQ